MDLGEGNRRVSRDDFIGRHAHPLVADGDVLDLDAMPVDPGLAAADAGCPDDAGHLQGFGPWGARCRFHGGHGTTKADCGHLRMNGKDDVVSASEIAAWAWCPESWRLAALGHEPGNKAALARGERHHERKAAFEERSRSAISLGWWLLAAALLLAVLALLLVRG